jgi:uncharacterized protein
MSTEVTNNTDKSRYEIFLDGKPAGYAEYRLRENHTVFVHTEIDRAFEGKGLGSVLAKAALDDVRAAGRSVVPLCPFIKGYIDRHAEYKDLLA